MRVERVRLIAGSLNVLTSSGLHGSMVMVLRESTNIEAWADIVPSVQILRNGHSVMQAAPGSAFPAGSTVFFADPLSATGLYRFLNWQVDEGVSQEEVQILGTRYLKILVSKDMNIQAVFEPIPS